LLGTADMKKKYLLSNQTTIVSLPQYGPRPSPETSDSAYHSGWETRIQRPERGRDTVWYVSGYTHMHETSNLLIPQAHKPLKILA
jgi:hypothetical protein